MITKLQVPRHVVSDTLASLRAAGAQGTERVVLWFGSKEDSVVIVDEAFTPPQVCDVDFFHISGDVLIEIARCVGSSGRMVAAQAHSHPGAAFHSEADDLWSVIRHAGGVSIVVPRFASSATVDTFLETSAVYRLSTENVWERVGVHEVEEVLELL